MHSVLEMPFPAAVKTGTSSDFRDTWTVGFTRDYTVAVWVGNFDGSAMRGVSGVTGAGPLWNRIMLHLHERKRPPPLRSPPGYVRVASARRPAVHVARATCPAVVQEWVKPQEIASLRPRNEPVTLRIAFPHDGDTSNVMPRKQRPASCAPSKLHSAQSALTERSIGALTAPRSRSTQPARPSGHSV